jgi:hypothetical protein
VHAILGSALRRAGGGDFSLRVLRVADDSRDGRRVRRGGWRGGDAFVWHDGAGPRSGGSGARRAQG